MAVHTYADDDEPTPYARKQIRPEDQAAAAKAAMAKAMAERPGGRR